jgi:hypothetical protein
LITNVTNVKEDDPTLPVTRQQPSLGNINPVAWNPVRPYPAGTTDRSGEEGASRRWPVMRK